MASFSQRIQGSTWWPALSVYGLAFWVALGVEGPLWTGGLAPVAVAALAAGFLGVPLARAEWRLSGDPHPVAGPLGETLVLLAAGAVAGQLVAEGPPLAWVALFIGWPALAYAVGRWGAWVGGGLALVVTVWALTWGAFCGLRTPGVTLLEPHWETWQQWLPWSLVAGLLLATAGLERWAQAPAAVPGHRQVPWAAAGLGLLVTLSASIVAAAAAEGTATEGAMTVLTAPMGVALCAVALGGRRPGQLRHLAIGFLTSLWFAGPGSGGLDVFWQAILPLGLAVNLALLALRARGQVRITAGLGAGAALFAAGLGWPGIPASALDAAAAAATVVVLVWIVGTRGLLHAKRVTS